MFTIAKTNVAAALIVAATLVIGGRVAVVPQVAQGQPPRPDVNVMSHKGIPLNVVWMGTADRKRSLDGPKIMLGRRPAAVDAIPSKLSGGAFQLQPSVDDQETVLLLAGPSLNVGEAWGPRRGVCRACQACIENEIQDRALVGQRHFVDSFNRKPNGLRELRQNGLRSATSPDAHADGDAVKRLAPIINAKVALSNFGQ